MSGLAVSVDVQGLEQLQRKLNRLATLSSSGDLHQLMDEVGEAAVSTARLAFTQQQAPDGTPWKQSRRAMATGGKTLRHRGHLMNSIGYEASDSQVEWGTNLIYGPIQHLGGTIKPKKSKALAFGGRLVSQVTIPARRFLPENASQIDDLSGVLDDWMERILA